MTCVVSRIFIGTDGFEKERRRWKRNFKPLACAKTRVEETDLRTTLEESEP